MTIHILRRISPLAVALAMLSCGPAFAASDDAVAMPLGVASPAPAGFIELCERSPSECLAVAAPTDQMLADVRDWAGRARWNSVFQAAGLASPPAAIPTPTRTFIADWRQEKAASPEDVRAEKDRRRKEARRRPLKAQPRPAPDLGPASIQPEPEAATPVTSAASVAEISTADLEALSRRINRAIRRSSDADAYGREDVWVLPEGRRPRGDCEDYVLAKRRALIEDGVDPAALAIAIVRTRRGETHAVLLVTTRDGEQVLDNLSPWVLPWREAPYEWLERQAPGQPLIWVRAA